MTAAAADDASATGVRPAFATAALASAALAAVLGSGPAGLALIGLAGLWLASRPPRAERWLGAAGLGAAAVLLLAVGWFSDASRAGPESRLEALAGDYEELWTGLEQAAEAAVATLGEPPRTADAQLAAFARLGELTAADADATTLLLLDADGDAVAWAGPGLLHEPTASDLLASGSPAGVSFRRSYGAVSAIAVRQLAGAGRPWRLLAGRSFAADQLPFAAAPSASRWTIAAPGRGRPGALEVAVAGRPSLYLAAAGADDGDRAGRLRRVACGLLAATLFAIAVRRFAGRDPAGPAPTVLATGLLLPAAGAALAGAAFGLPPAVNGTLIGAAAFAVFVLTQARRAGPPAGLAAGAFAALAIAAIAWLCHQHVASLDLASEFVGGAPQVALRLSMSLVALGLLVLASQRPAEVAGDGTAWMALVALLAAAAAHDLPWVALPLLAVGGALTVRWLSSVDLHRPWTVITALVLAVLAAAAAWETAYRELFRQSLADHYLPAVAPPTSAEVDELHRELFAWFDRHELAPQLPLATGRIGTDAEDLAYLLWRDSPLPERDGLSAVTVLPYTGAPSSFSFGLALDDRFERVVGARWLSPEVAAWQEAAILGETELVLDGEPWGLARYWFLPRPGFRLGTDEADELAATLVRGKPERQAVDGLPRPVLYALYDSAGLARVSPWPEAPPLDLAGLAENSTRLRTPAGLSWYWARAGSDGIAVLYLPVLSPLEGLERVGIHGLGALLILGAIGALIAVLVLPRVVLGRLLGTTVRSYSKRLLLVYTLLLLVPLVALNLVLLRSYEQRLRQEQLHRGEAAMASARLFLLDYLSGLEPGFGIDTQVRQELLVWISQVVQQQVNLYWGSRVYQSSQEELFTAGLLPRRIPGEVFSPLALLGHDLGFRTQRSGDLTYLELYAPLDVPELRSSQSGLFLSTPLLAQEEAVARELATMRGRAALVTTALFLLLLAVGRRLARSFTRPIVELIEGTRKIAAGAPSLEATPREQELEALAGAIDDMARRIAEGRRKLLREKQVVEGVVENIISGIVSLDRERCVLLHNRVAAEMLGSRIGHDIDAALAGDERLRPVRDFVAAAGGRPKQATVRLTEEGGEAREWTLTWAPLPGTVDPSALLVVDDSTEVLRGQRLEAWAEMARIIAHEIKNPLTPIRLSAEHMRQVYRVDRDRFDEVFERCTRNILDQVEELREIASEFSTYSRIPKAELDHGDLVVAMAELVDAYRDATPSGVDVELIAEEPALELRFDRKLLGRAVRNLIENALRASPPGGRVTLALGASPANAPENVVLRVVDSGPGVAAEHLRRIFEPYFSTHDSGTGLGLAIARRIAEEHGGRIDAANRSGGGLEVTITIPLNESPATAERPAPVVEDAM